MHLGGYENQAQTSHCRIAESAAAANSSCACALCSMRMRSSDLIAQPGHSQLDRWTAAVGQRRATEQQVPATATAMTAHRAVAVVTVGSMEQRETPPRAAHPRRHRRRPASTSRSPARRIPTAVATPHAEAVVPAAARKAPNRAHFGRGLNNTGAQARAGHAPRAVAPQGGSAGWRRRSFGAAEWRSHVPWELRVSTPARSEQAPLPLATYNTTRAGSGENSWATMSDESLAKRPRELPLPASPLAAASVLAQRPESPAAQLRRERTWEPAIAAAVGAAPPAPDVVEWLAAAHLEPGEVARWAEERIAREWIRRREAMAGARPNSACGVRQPRPASAAPSMTPSVVTVESGGLQPAGDDENASLAAEAEVEEWLQRRRGRDPRALLLRQQRPRSSSLASSSSLSSSSSSSWGASAAAVAPAGTTGVGALRRSRHSFMIDQGTRRVVGQLQPRPSIESTLRRQARALYRPQTTGSGRFTWGMLEPASTGASINCGWGS
jgi:hypothetical protein